MKKQKGQRSLSQLRSSRKKAWTEFSKYIRLRDALLTTGTPHTLICCSCGKPYSAFGKGCAQAGHFIPGRSNAILFREDCVHGQCYNCNVKLKGNWPGYMSFIEKRYGPHKVDELRRLRFQTRKYTAAELDEMAEDYKDRYQMLKDGGIAGLSIRKILPGEAQAKKENK